MRFSWDNYAAEAKSRNEVVRVLNEINKADAMANTNIAVRDSIATITKEDIARTTELYDVPSYNYLAFNNGNAVPRQSLEQVVKVLRCPLFKEDLEAMEYFVAVSKTAVGTVNDYVNELDNVKCLSTSEVEIALQVERYN